MRKPWTAFLFLVATLSVPTAARAQRAVILVRHADKISANDERLSDAGRARAARLATILKDAGVTAIYATETERAIDTAKPLADAFKLRLQSYDIGSGHKVRAKPFVARLAREQGEGIVLVVGHSNSLPDLLKALGCASEVSIAQEEYDNLFIVVPKGDKAELIRLRY
jgi:probable phosphoglycerate mutase